MKKLREEYLSVFIAARRDAHLSVYKRYMLIHPYVGYWDVGMGVFDVLLIPG